MLSEHPPNSISEATIRDRIYRIYKALIDEGMRVRTESRMRSSELLALRELLGKGQCTGYDTLLKTAWIVYQVDPSLDEPQKPQNAHIGVITPIFGKEHYRLRCQLRSSNKSCQIYKGIEAIFAAAKEGGFPFSDTYAISAGVFLPNDHPLVCPSHPDKVLNYTALAAQSLRSPMMIDPSALVTVKVPSTTSDWRPVIPSYGHPAYLARQWFYLVAGVYQGALAPSNRHRESIEDLYKTWRIAENNKPRAWTAIRRLLERYFRHGNIRQTDVTFWDNRWAEFGKHYCKMDKRSVGNK
ncbi:hypothetical protein MHUMG1_02589 [Metarhizium humberi]|uniref:Uncharacterized protein n=1 Tax=Metarhizium humberi TaxID=2596975 RepID=A0A9P8MI83_9HYPO|nr:hypothetical protein MHUMG1_02589 [Metarhizium humberi]